ncbi:single-stranded-DNA-specific exonuclease RecJ [Crateriforma spongiae]|uniref:single-stranded-DNA-specific exonuclease RecJ n=1 Tax=Crateriforma spongiae TaxID=2724528 RepID=UPI00144873EF|nr:single-stranded-DNA-specific exonuclease RecJ [Crateriforma spongiae]
MKRAWRVVPHDSARVQRLANSARLPAVVAQLMVSRGIYDGDAAKQFLDTRLSGLRDPDGLPGIAEATERIMRSVKNDEPIVVYGDYDADGMTGTAILVNCLNLIGARVSYHIPNRLEDGYGLNADAIRKLADRGKRLIVSVDCGVTSVTCAELCKELGVGLVITDHHQMDDQLPDADAIVHPRLPGTAYPFGELCGAGVAFKLAWSLCQAHCGAKKVSDRMKNFLMDSLGLAAIGTIADVVPLLDENRILVEHGLKVLKNRPRPGLAEIIRRNGLDRGSTMTTENVSYTLAPRLNAAGRLGQAQLAVELMTATDPDRIAALAEYLDQLNGTRESLQRSVYLAANKQIADQFDGENDAALVLNGVGWHQGVIGIVAGRLSDKYAKPVIVISMDSAGRGEAVGSGRVGGTNIDLHEALSNCSERLVRFGGHQAAAGITIEERQIDAFRGDFCEAVARQWSERDVTPEIVIDAEAPLTQLTLETMKHIDMMAPFGAGNPRPILMARDIRLDQPARRMGGGDRHLTVTLRQGERTIRGVAFGCGDWCDELNACEGPIEVAFRPVINEFRGYRNVEVQLVDWRPSETYAPV